MLRVIPTFLKSYSIFGILSVFSYFLIANLVVLVVFVVFFCVFVVLVLFSVVVLFGDKIRERKKERNTLQNNNMDNIYNMSK